MNTSGGKTLSPVTPPCWITKNSVQVQAQHACEGRVMSFLHTHDIFTNGSGVNTFVQCEVTKGGGELRARQCTLYLRVFMPDLTKSFALDLWNRSIS